MALPLDPNLAYLTTEAIIRAELQYLANDLAALDKYRDYYEGDQSLVLGTTRFKDVFGEDFERFKDNWCRPTVNAVLDKLTLQSFTTPNGDNPSLTDAVWDILARNEIESQQIEHHQTILVEGRSTIIVWPNPQAPGGVQVDWNPPQMVRVRYSEDNPRIPEWAVKRWRTPAGEVRVTIYYPDRVEKYIDAGRDSTRSDEDGKYGVRATRPNTSPMSSLMPRRIPNEPWPLPNPLGVVPVVEFHNPSGSELKDVIPIQDWINYSIIKLMVGGEFSSWPQRAVAWDGEAPDGGWSNHPGRVWQFPHKLDVDGKPMPVDFHTFPAADQSKIIDEIEMALQHIALITGTPVRYYKQDDRGGRGDAPSGESLKVTDQPLIDKIETRQVLYGAKWATVGELVARAMVGGTANLLDPSLRLIPRWKDARAEYRFAVLQEAALMKEIGLPFEFIVGKLGLSKEEEQMILTLGAGAGYEAMDGREGATNGPDGDGSDGGGPAGAPPPPNPPTGAAAPGITRGQV